MTVVVFLLVFSGFVFIWVYLLRVELCRHFIGFCGYLLIDVSTKKYKCGSFDQKWTALEMDYKYL